MLTKSTFPQFKFSRYILVLCSPYFFVWKPKGDSSIKIFIENQLPVRTSQIHGLMTVFLKKLEGMSFSELYYTRFELPQVTRSTYIV